MFVTKLLRSAATDAAPSYYPQRTHFTSLVSFRRAPGFRQAPIESLRRPVEDVPETDVGAFVLPEVISEAEERALLHFTGPLFGRLPFCQAHLDALIHHYKEFYRPMDQLLARAVDPSQSDFNNAVGDAAKHSATARETLDTVASVVERLTALVQSNYLPHIPLANRVHFLQIHGDGFIRGHVDESRNSTGVVAGLTLGSGRVMNLTHPKHPGVAVDLLLAPRSFYILASRARYEWLHSVDCEASEDEEYLRRIVGSSASAEPGSKVDVTGAASAASDVVSTPSWPPLSVGDVVVGSPVMFDGQDSGLRRDTRTAIIFRGVSPMELLMRRMKARPG